MIKKIFSFDFEENIKERDKFDGVFSVIVFLYSLLAIYLCAKVIMNWQPYGDFVSKFENPYLGTLISNIPIAIVQVFPIFIILLARKQKLSSIGFKLKGSLWQILLGIVFTIPIMIKPYLDFKKMCIPLNLEFTIDKFYMLIYFIITIAFVEEVIFRGYILTRLQGLIKNKYIVCIIVDLMFAMLHIPFQMVMSSMSFVDYIQASKEQLITCFIMHFYYSYIYTRDNNILAPITTHALYDFLCVALYM